MAVQRFRVDIEVASISFGVLGTALVMQIFAVPV
jgi:hypothetical protein